MASSTLLPSATSTAPPAATSTGSNDDDSGPTSRPLLFFVALGFGVVFTNLWLVKVFFITDTSDFFYRIIVGVKYCFRYNQRARQGLINEENGERIDMGNVGRPRRRREKKLMSMDEVNDRFPLTRYKVWRASRETQGLSTAGGITAPPSRAGSIRREAGIVRASADQSRNNDKSVPALEEPAALNATSQGHDFAAHTSTERKSQDEAPKEDKKDHAAEDSRISKEKPDGPAQLLTADGHPPERVASATSAETGEDDDEDDPIRNPVPTEYLSAPGDSCAICIDALEEDDEVRGLTCGHAFHAGCLDPWLTSRRACCPLCKADFYVPKPRPDGEGQDGGDTDTTNSDGLGPTEPRPVWVAGRGGFPFRARMLLSRTDPSNNNQRLRGLSIFSSAPPPPQRTPRRSNRRQQQQAAPTSETNTASQNRPAQATTWIRTLPSNLPTIRVPRFGHRNRGNETPASGNEATANDLEAGRR